MNLVLKTILGLEFLIIGGFGFYATIIKENCLKDNLPLTLTILLVSSAFLVAGLILIIGQEVKEKAQIKLDE